MSTLLYRVLLTSVIALLFLGCQSTIPVAKEQADEHHTPAREQLPENKVKELVRNQRLALQENPLNQEAHYVLASLLAYQGKEEQAMIGFQRAITIDPTHSKALYNLGTLMLQRGEAVPAAQLLEAAVTNDPSDLSSYNNLAKAYFMSGLPELTVATYEEVLRRDGENVIASHNRALLVAANEQTPPEDDEQESEDDEQESEDDEQESADDDEKPSAAVDKPAEPYDQLMLAEQSPEEQEDPIKFSKKKAEELRELIKDLEYVKVEERRELIVLTGWTRGKRERLLLDKVLAGWSKVLDLTGDDFGDPQRMLEVDAVLFIVTGQKNESVGFNFLRLIDFSFTTFAASDPLKLTGLKAPGTIDKVLDLPSSGSLLVASVDYDVNIANAANDRVAVLARPHLTTINGTPASFLAGGEFVFRVSGIESGDIKPYPFGTSLTVTPTLLRTKSDDGLPRVHLEIKAERTSVLQFLTAVTKDDSVVFDKLTVSSQAVLDLGQTLILSGLNQRESRVASSGVPILKDIPGLKWFFSSDSTVEENTAIIILLTPRDPAYMDKRNRSQLGRFVKMRQAFMKAKRGTRADMKKFKEEYPNWYSLPPNRFSSHFFMVENSDLYRSVSASNIVHENLDLNLLGDVLEGAKKKKNNVDDIQGTE